MRPSQAAVLVLLAAALPALPGCPPAPPPDPCDDSCSTTVYAPGTYRIRYEDADGVERTGNFQPDEVGFIGICDCTRILGEPMILIGPPVCALGVPDPATLDVQPYAVRSIGIEGVMEPDGGRIRITFDAIYQDEPTFGLYPGDRYPDAALLNGAVRMECDPAGNGRVYTIEYTATDDDGESCQGVVRVCVPVTPGGTCVDDGPLYDSRTRPEVDLSVTLTHSLESNEVGSPLTFIATVTNHGVTHADRARLRLEPVSNVPLHSFSGECEQGFIRGVECEFENLAAGASLTYTMAVLPSSAGRHSATADVDGVVPGYDDPDPTNNYASDFVDVGVSAGSDLRVAATLSPTAVRIGEDLTCTITVTNDGPEPATGVVMTARMSTAQFVSASSGCTEAEFRVSCAPDAPNSSLGVGESATFSVVFRPTVVGFVAASVDVTSATVDQYAGNNAIFPSATVSSPPSGPSPPSGADLVVTIVDAPDPVIIEFPLVYTTTVTNDGPDAASAVVLTVTLPETAEIGGSTTTQGTVSLSGRVLTVSLGSLASGAGATVATTLYPFAAGTISAQASAAGAEADPDTTNDSAAATTMVILP